MGFTPLSEKLDPEDVYNLMQGCLGCMMEAVHTYEGTITQFTGDGVLALFGAPIAHEDAARRAVAAALDMQKTLGEYADTVHQKHRVQCRFRVGLNTGPVVVGRISDNLDMDFTALGDTVNLASRMEELAEPGAVYLTENTYRAASEYFEFTPLGALLVKGKSEPVVAYKALKEKGDIRTRFQAAAERGLTPFVGREQELNVLRGYFDQVKRGQGHVVLVSGEAGLGKSRLMLEFRRSIVDEPHKWLEGHCISYGKSIPYLPVADIVKRNFGVEEGDAEETIIERVERGVSHWNDDARATAPHLRYLLNVDQGDVRVAQIDPMERRAATLDGLRALLLQESARRPLVVLVEDLHWIDEMSEDALNAMVDLVATAPVLLVLTHRPGYSHPLADRTYFSRLAISVLRPEESAIVAERVLGAETLPADLKNLITGKGEGNPFYIEEVTKSLVERGVLVKSNGSYALSLAAADVEVPDTIQEVILSRIDRLGPEAKGALQLASVIGREFTVRLLGRISDIEAGLDQLLGGLKVLELIYEKAYFPELAYMFKHALTHDVAYSTLLLERRKALHSLAASAIEELYAERLPEQYEALAYHYYEGQDWGKALEYLEKAGDKAAAAYANQDALDYYARAIETGERLGGHGLTTASAIAEKRGFLNFGIGAPDDAVGDFEGALRLARAIGDRRGEGLALAWMGSMHTWGSDPEQGWRCFDQALAVAEEGHADVRAIAGCWSGMMLITYGNLEEGRPLLDEADELIGELGEPLTRGFWAWYRGLSRNWEAQYDRSLEHLDRWQSALDQTVLTHTGRLWNESLALTGKGEYQKALSVLDEAIAICERTGEMLVRARALNTVGWILVELQNHDAAMEWNTRSEEVALVINAPDPEIESNARLNLGDSLCALGRLDEAGKYFDIVEQTVRHATPREHFALWSYSQHFFHSCGELWLKRGDYKQALGLADECIKLAESTNRPKNVIKGRRLRGQVLLALGKPDQAEPELDMALAIAMEIGNPPQLWKTYVALGDLRKAQGRPDDARKAYRDGYAVVQRVAEGLEDEMLRETFLGSEHVQGIRKAAAAAG